jgi:hypothetical protein
MMKKIAVALLGTFLITGCATTAAVQSGAPPATSSASAGVVVISQQEMDNARKVWGEALVAISTAYESGGRTAATAAANGALDGAYGYNMGPVLFKPTLTSGAQTFRTTRDGALSYFVGGNPAYAQDSGFAIKGWRSVETITAATFMEDDVAMWMGNVRMTDKDGKVTVVDKSWGYKKDANGVVRIVLHHSSLPYQP